MLAYAANRPAVGKRESSPNALLVVISVHVALLAAVMSAKMDVTKIIRPEPPLIKVPITPEPVQTESHPKQQTRQTTHIDNPTHVIKTQTADHTTVDDKVVAWNPPSGDTDLGGTPEIPKHVATAPIRHDAQLLTPASELRPPYPADKLAAEQEATLKLALTIDPNGHVTAVEPVGPADREFLAAARRYIIAHWRYQPASEDGRPISSNLTITLRFQLDG